MQIYLDRDDLKKRRHEEKYDTPSPLQEPAQVYSAGSMFGVMGLISVPSSCSTR